MPLLPPVITATLPFSFDILLLLCIQELTARRQLHFLRARELPKQIDCRLLKELPF
jgi:hypothetical protein